MEQALARSRSAEQEKVAAVMVVKGVELEVEATVEDKMVGAATVEMRVGAATALCGARRFASCTLVC